MTAWMWAGLLSQRSRHASRVTIGDEDFVRERKAEKEKKARDAAEISRDLVEM